MVVTTPTVLCDSTHFLWHHLATPLHLGCAGNSSDNTIAHNAMLMLHAMLQVASLKATHYPFSMRLLVHALELYYLQYTVAGSQTACRHLATTFRLP